MGQNSPKSYENSPLLNNRNKDVKSDLQGISLNYFWDNTSTLEFSPINWQL